MECKTVKVVSDVSEGNQHGYIVINESDLTEDHELFIDGTEQAKKPSRGKKQEKPAE